MRHQTVFWICAVLVFVLTAHWPLRAEAQFFTGAAASGMGGAGRAAVDPSESILLNPAAVAHMPDYFISGQYALGWHPVDGNSKTWAVTASDGSPENLVAGAVTYVNRTRYPHVGASIDEDDLQIGIAGVVFRRISLGVSGHRLTWKQKTFVDESVEHEQTNMNVGLLYTPTEWLGFSLTGHDVLPADEKIPLGVRVIPTFALGSNAIIQKTFRLRLDLVKPEKENPGNRINVLAGLESYFLEKLAFRLGAHWRETADQTLVSTGIAFKGPRLSFDYTFERDVRTADGSRHLFDLWLPF